VNLTVSYLRAAKSGKISAVARMLSQGKSISQWQVDMSDEEGRLLAVSSVSYSIKR